MYHNAAVQLLDSNTRGHESIDTNVLHTQCSLACFFVPYNLRKRSRREVVRAHCGSKTPASQRRRTIRDDCPQTDNQESQGHAHGQHAQRDLKGWPPTQTTHKAKHVVDSQKRRPIFRHPLILVLASVTKIWSD